jgi:ribonuclease P protein component
LAAGERLCRTDVLRLPAEYLRCYRSGRRKSGTLLHVYCHPNDMQHPRLGITASRKVGSSVVRHRLKRRVRESFRREPLRRTLPALDLVIHLQPSAGRATFRALRAELSRLLLLAARGCAPR